MLGKLSPPHGLCDNVGTFLQILRRAVGRFVAVSVLIGEPGLLVAHLDHRVAQFVDRVDLALDVGRRHGHADLVVFVEHAVGAVVVVLTLHVVVEILLVQFDVGAADHRRDKFAVLPVGLARVVEHGVDGRVPRLLLRQRLLGLRQRRGDVFVLDHERRHVEPEVLGRAPRHGAVLEDGRSEWLGEVRGLVGIAEDERAEDHSALTITC